MEGGGGRQHVEMHAADVKGVPGRRNHRVQSVCAQHGSDELHARGWVGQRSGEHLADPSAVQDTSYATDVIEVIVAEDQ